MIRTLIRLMIITLTGIATIVSSEIVPSYDRSEWRHWVDEDKDCQDTRQEVLILTGTLLKFSDTGCKVVSGVWYDQYGDTYLYDPSLIDIDHVVPLYNAHVSGGWKWSYEEKRRFANDIENLTSTSQHENRSKGNRTPDLWMPRTFSYWCEYVSKWTSIKEKYQLSYTNDEFAVVYIVNKTCN